MTLTELLLGELDTELAATRKVLGRLPGDRLDWRPHARSWTLAQLATHTLMIPEWGRVTLTTKFYDLAPAGGPIPSPRPIESVEEALERLDNNGAGARAALAACKGRALDAPWSLLMGGKIISTHSRLQVWRGMIMNHMIHHRGQLGLCLRLLNEPVPAVYGPSADEQA
jgi:uncharacterized damage-inducible protein DinB